MLAAVRKRVYSVVRSRISAVSTRFAAARCAGGFARRAAEAAAVLVKAGGLCRRGRAAQCTEADVDVGELRKTTLLGGRQLPQFNIANGVSTVFKRPFNGQQLVFQPGKLGLQ